jgi:hypothetical protein
MKKLIYILIGIYITSGIAYAQTINVVPGLTKVSSGDKTPGYLSSKVIAGSGAS